MGTDCRVDHHSRFPGGSARSQADRRRSRRERSVHADRLLRQSGANGKDRRRCLDFDLGLTWSQLFSQ